MKHPSFKQLQDYFENESSTFDDEQMRDHLENCDKCSKVISEMAKVDVLFSKTENIVLKEEVKIEVMSAAKELLAKRRHLLEQKELKKENRKEKIKDAIQHLQDLKESALAELKIPALQTAAISLFLIVLTKMATTQTVTEHYKIINDDVQVISSELSGDDNEIY